jgi:hypothetical protein
MPEAPLDRLAIFSTISRRVTSSDSRAPTPQAWLRTRFFCRVSRSSGAIEVLASRPKPVLMP